MFVGIATFLGVVEISCNRITCGIGGGVCCWGEVGCWCVTFFSLLGLVVVEAVQNSPCWRKVGRNRRFGACRESFVPVSPAGGTCWESFVPGGPAGGASWESFVPAQAPNAVQRSPCVVCLQPEREKVLPARVKRAEKGYFGRAGRVLYRYRPPGCVRGEFCPDRAFSVRPALQSPPQQPPQPTSRAPAPREKGKLATAWCRRKTLTPRPRPTRGG